MADTTVDSEQRFPDLSAYRGTDRSRGNAVASVTRALREAIFDGALAPGQWLREESLAESFGVSRTPLREALNRLEEEGLITRERGSGARVSALTVEDMLVVYQVRGSLESVAASIAAERASDEQLARLEQLDALMAQAAESAMGQHFNELNIEFHRTLASAATNVYLRRLLSTVETAIRRFGARSYTPERMRQIVEEHRDITRAIVARDSSAAADASQRHAASAREATLRRLIPN